VIVLHTPKLNSWQTSRISFVDCPTGLHRHNKYRNKLITTPARNPKLNIIPHIQTSSLDLLSSRRTISTPPESEDPDGDRLKLPFNGVLEGYVRPVRVRSGASRGQPHQPRMVPATITAYDLIGMAVGRVKSGFRQS
jgi:hypothetical protein